MFQMLARVLGFLSAMLEPHIEFWVPVFSLTQPWLLWALTEWTSSSKIYPSLCASKKNQYTAFKKQKRSLLANAAVDFGVRVNSVIPHHPYHNCVGFQLPSFLIKNIPCSPSLPEPLFTSLWSTLCLEYGNSIVLRASHLNSVMI